MLQRGWVKLLEIKRLRARELLKSVGYVYKAGEIIIVKEEVYNLREEDKSHMEDLENIINNSLWIIIGNNNTW